MADLRVAQRAITERSIIDAVHRVLADEHPSSMSMPQVADAAGVSLRTLYRYFPTKADLVDAASRSFEVEVEVAPPEGIDDVEPYLAAMWRAFDARLPAVLAQHATAAGRELRQRRLARSRAHLSRVFAVAAAAADLTPREIERVVDTVILLTGSATYLELTQHLGYPSDDAARLMSTAVRAVVENAIGRSV